MARCVTVAVSSIMLAWTGAACAAAPLEFGFGRSEITPTRPLRLSGYGNRSEPSEGVDEPLWVRALALREGHDGPLHVLVSVDTIGVPGAMTRGIHERIAARHDVSRDRFVICSTHSHTAPHLAVALTNLFATPLTDNQRRDLDEYAVQVSDQIVAAVERAAADLQPGRMFVGQGEATFAVNRRILKDGVWTGFGVNPDGPVDHSLPIIRITDQSGGTTRGLVFNYACHCTTFDSNYNRVNGDWAGYAAQYLEEAHPGATALCTIGCGADANPQRDRVRALEIAQVQGREIADEVSRVVAGAMTEVTSAPQASFGYAGLPIDRPTREELRARLNDNSPQVRRHAENMLAIHQRMGRLPETYPMPIQVFRFGDQFCMVFLGGEVCVDYAFRIKKELGRPAAAATDAGPERVPVWVTAYANDVFGYVAPERMRAEGGYEVDFSMIYYNQPGPWSSGTEEVILRRVHELYNSTGEVGPLAPEQCLRLFTVPEGFTVDIVAAEPLIRDPINFSLGADGRLWVVEMGDYPNGNPDLPRDNRPDRRMWEGPPGGRVKVLTDQDADGRYDQAVTFLDGLTMPTGIFPWRDGVVVAAAPEIFFARDRDGDSRADERKPLFSGFSEGNPQHRVNGFDYGLDGWLYVADTSSSRSITSAMTGEQITTSGRDLRIDPDRGRAVPVSGTSQYGRCRDDWGNWFGNNNSEPLFHFAIEDRYLQRNLYVASPSPRVFLTEPSAAPRVYPTSRTLDRFNDLHTLDRFTSACSPLIVRDSDLPDDLHAAALVCEPVHNLVSRVMLEPSGVTFRGGRHESERQREFLSSRDNWFRPVHLETGPDASIWVCDMYRQVIEHPQWIPEAWQARLDLYAGRDKGRIYRVRRSHRSIMASPNLAALSGPELVEQIGSPNGWRRDTAQRLLLEREDQSVVPDLEGLVATHSRPEVRAQALATLSGLNRLAAQSLLNALDDSDPRVVVVAIRFAEPQIANPQVVTRLLELAGHADRRVRYQVALSLGESADSRVAAALLSLARADADADDPWIRAAVLSSAVPHARALLTDLLDVECPPKLREALLQDVIAAALGDDVPARLGEMIATLDLNAGRTEIAEWQVDALAACIQAVQSRGQDWSAVARASHSEGGTIEEAARPVFAAARRIADDDRAPLDRRASAVRLLGQDELTREEDVARLVAWIAPQFPIELQVAAIRALAACRPELVTDVLLSNWHEQTPPVRAEVLSTLLSRDEWRSAFVAAVEQGRVPVRDLDAATRARLQYHLRRSGRNWSRALSDATDAADRSAIVASMQSAAALKGEPERGAILFKKVCSACHQHGGIGNDLGPRLSNLNDKSADALLTALFDPNRAVEQRFRGYVIATRDGRTTSGLIKSETAGSLTLVEPNGTEHVILRIDIEEMTDTGKSFMPDGLEKDLSPQDVADLIAFVTRGE